MKKTICLFLCLLLFLPTLSSCSKPPAYEEIEGRLKELVAASAEINAIFFGEGLQTYERVYDPRNSTALYVDEATGKKYHYYELEDEQLGRVIAFRQTAAITSPFTYVQVLTVPKEGHTPDYVREEGLYCYRLEDYSEPEYEFFYGRNDPTEYDYVRYDEKYVSVEQIKAAAEQVYSAEYLTSVYDSIFIGSAAATETVEGLSARYIEFDHGDGTVSLMRSNTFEPLVTEVRQYDFSTASIIKPSNREYVTISIESYLPSTPNDRLTVRLSMVLQDGVWMLDSATY
ncbi:MAG: hypothetical protein E7668_01455 [Ruminococcaceae bacterium]|nr:hypothetical protein [Oscillospiraceae bacterium]